MRARWGERHIFTMFALAYAGASALGRATVLPGEQVSLAWPAAGIAVLWLLHTRRPSTVLVVMTVELAGVLLATGASPVLTCVGIVAATVQTVVVVSLVRRWVPGTLGAGGQGSIHSLPVLTRGAAAVVVGCLAGAAVGTVGLWLDTGGVTWRDSALLFGRQFGGVMIVGSVGHLTWERLVRPTPARLRGPAAVELTVLWIISAAVYGSVFFLELPLTYFAIPLSVWCAVRFSTYAATVHAAGFGTVAIALTLADRGPFAPLEDPAVAALLTQAFVLVALLTALVVGSVRDQREDLVARLMTSESTAARRAQLLAAMTEAMTEGLVVVDSTGEVIRTNDAARRLLARTSVGGEANAVDYDLLRPDGSPLTPDELPSRRALVEGDVAAHDVVVPLEDGQRRTVSVRATALPAGAETSDGPAALLVYRDVTRERAQSHRLVEFAEVAAHELRSPLTTVHGWVSMAAHELARDTPSIDNAARVLGKALTGTRQLDELIDSILDQALAEGSDLDLQPLALGGPDGLVADVGDLLGVPHLDVQGPLGAVVLADERALRQVFANLLGNAVKYASSDRQLEVTVEVSTRGRRVDVAITDNGRGIATDQQDTIFRRFNRAEAADTVRGTGLGLSICQLVVERHGGTIRAEAGPRGVGTTFSFDLPAYLPVRAPDDTHA